MLAQWKEIIIHDDNKIFKIYKLNDKERLENPFKQKRRRFTDRKKNDDQKTELNENSSKKKYKESRKKVFQICNQDIFSYIGEDLQNYLQNKDNPDQKRVKIKEQNQNGNINFNFSLESILNSIEYAQQENELDDDVQM